MQLLQRLLLAASFGGLYVTGVLSLGHVLGISPPCGGSSGCDIIAQHPRAFWMGVPVAFFGVAGYLALIVAGAMRLRTGGAKWLHSALAISLVGTLVSGYLTYLAQRVIAEQCGWCLASAGVMLLLLVGYSFMAFARQPLAPKWRQDTKLVAVLALTVGIALSVQGAMLANDAAQAPADLALLRSLSTDAIIPKGAPATGPAEASVTVVIFSDFMCPACRKIHPELEGLSEEGVRLVFRYFP
ncbi:MAG TPA: vitamin K epoxide reductase family protein, partial [Fimbriimonadaceae bacterium]|nr:vitamin K epoxide reductase family protein [Fimbriimonadaceae bacterium]